MRQTKYYVFCGVRGTEWNMSFHSKPFYYSLQRATKVALKANKAGLDAVVVGQLRGDDGRMGLSYSKDYIVKD